MTRISQGAGGVRWLRGPAEAVRGTRRVLALAGGRDEDAPETWVRQLAGPLEWFDPMQRPAARLAPRVYIELANVRGPGDAARFASAWGLLQLPPAGLRPGARCVVDAPLPPNAPARAHTEPLSPEARAWLAQSAAWQGLSPEGGADAVWIAGEAWSDWRRRIAELRAALVLAVVIRAAPDELDADYLHIDAAVAAEALLELGGRVVPESWPAARRAAPSVLASAFGHRERGALRCEAFVRDDGGVSVQAAPATLLAAAWLQFGRDLSAGRRWRVCARPGCGGFLRVEREDQQWCPRCGGGYGRVVRQRGGGAAARPARARLWPDAE